MRDITTDDLVQRIILHTRALTKAEDILLLSKTAANASKVKECQRYQRQALIALNKHLKQCIKIVQTAQKRSKKA